MMYMTIILLFSFNLEANQFTKMATIKPTLIQDGKEKHWCPICGMKLKMFYKTSHTSKLQNGTKRQYCSIRCLVVDMQEHKINLNAVTVVDAKTQKLINANGAFYVINSTVQGTMSKKSKLAFALKTDAQEFIKKYKGNIITFDTALKSAQKSLKSDVAMVNKKKKKKVYPMGKKIFEKKCNQDIDPNNYIEINELKSALKNDKLCKPLKEKRLQAVTLYLWEVKRFGDLEKITGKIEVQKDEKCPVCGMFTYKYPKWAAQIFYKHNNQEHHWSFDGVKDLMKFYFDAQKWGNYPMAKRKNITKILVTDYYSQKAIDGTEAFYVIRSDVYGPMGNEFIPFENETDAKTFKRDHYGKKIIKFKDIKEEAVYQLDNDE